MASRSLPTIPIADVAKHNSRESCYVTVGVKVYDVTDFLPDHPGGDDLILQYSGKDVTEIMDDEISHKHSGSAYDILDDSCIGFLATRDDRLFLLPNDITHQVKDGNAVPSLDMGGKEIFSSSGLPGPEDLFKSTDETEDYNKHRFLDLRKPLLMQVWRSGFSKEFYLEQVHRPRCYKGAKSALLFGNFLEPLSLTPLWVVPIIWLPCVAYGLWIASKGLGSPGPTAIYCILGLFLWTLVEYSVHRSVGHMDRYLPNNRLGITAHFLLHGMHHYLPMDKYRTATSPALFFLSAIPFLKLSHLIFYYNWYAATTVFCGGVLGYVYYEVVHYFLHQQHLPTYYKNLKKHHLQHHYKDYENGFGVSSRFWDVVFSTDLADTPTTAFPTKVPVQQLSQQRWDAQNMQRPINSVRAVSHDRFRATSFIEEGPAQKPVQKIPEQKWDAQSMKRLTAPLRAVSLDRLKTFNERCKKAKTAYFTSIANASTFISPKLGMWLASLCTSAQPDGFKRVIWSCGCGNEMYADVQEAVTGAAEKYAFDISRSVSELEAANLDQSAKSRTQSPGLRSRLFTSRSSTPQMQLAASQDQVTSSSTGASESSVTQQNVNSNLIQPSSPNIPIQQEQYPSNLTNRNSSSATSRLLSQPEKRFLLLCINVDKYLVSLKQINVTYMSDDQFLFFKIRQAYRELRGGRMGIFSIMLPLSVEIVKFELVPMKMSTPCVGVLETAYPPPLEVTNQRYHYIPCPINLKPPICANVFMHAFFHPGAHTFQFWLNRLPKKLKDELIISSSMEVQAPEPKIGWGIHIIEGLNWFFVTCMMIGLLLCTGVFAVVWSVVRHGNLQEGFGIGQYLVAIEAAIMSALIIKWTA